MAPHSMCARLCDQPQAPPPVVHSARTVRNDVNVKRDSITLEKSSGGDANTFHLRFAFDASRPCSVSVYVAATETTNDRNVTTRYVAAPGTQCVQGHHMCATVQVEAKARRRRVEARLLRQGCEANVQPS